MAAKIFFSLDLAAATLTTGGTVASGKEWAFSVVFCNRTDADIKIRFAVADADTPDAANYYLYDIEVPANDTLERGGHTAQAGKKIVVYAEKIGVSVNCHGYEE